MPLTPHVAALAVALLALGTAAVAQDRGPAPVQQASMALGTPPSLPLPLTHAAADRACRERCIASCRRAEDRCRSQNRGQAGVCRAEYQICARRCVVSCAGN